MAGKSHRAYRPLYGVPNVQNPDLAETLTTHSNKETRQRRPRMTFYRHPVLNRFVEFPHRTRVWLYFGQI